MTSELAGRFRRLVATSIDAVLVPSLTLFLVMITGVTEHAEDFMDRWWLLHVLLLAIFSYLLLNAVLLARRGQTIGKWVTGIAIAPAQDPLGKVPLWKLVCLRAPFFPLLFVVIVPYLAPLPLIDLLPIFGKQRRCVHDLACGTIVVRLSPVAMEQPEQ